MIVRLYMAEQDQPLEIQASELNYQHLTRYEEEPRITVTLSSYAKLDDDIEALAAAADETVTRIVVLYNEEAVYDLNRDFLVHEVNDSFSDRDGQRNVSCVFVHAN